MAVKYSPGSEPDEIKGMLNSFFDELIRAYPNKIIDISTWDHSRWDKSAGTLCNYLGYKQGLDFLSAYGFFVYDSSMIKGEQKSTNTNSPEVNRTNYSEANQSNYSEANQSNYSEVNRTNYSEDNRTKETKGNTKKIIIIILAFVLLVAAVVAGFYIYHTKTMNDLQAQMEEEQAKKELLDKRVQEVLNNLDASEQEKQDLLDKIDNLLATEEYTFDAAAITEEIRSIGELATVEYRYTNVGTIDAAKYFKIIKWAIPGSQKTAVVSMDGTLKVGVDVTKIVVSSDEKTNTITVELPEAKLISNELDEASMQVYDESSGLFNDITLEDSSAIRTEIKSKAEENAKKSNVYEDAKKNARSLILCILESIPGVKERYTIVFK